MAADRSVLDFDADFGVANDDWREHDSNDPDDELLPQTPPDVVEILGFDPLDDDRYRADREFRESEHPRDADGKFVIASSHGASGRTTEHGRPLPEHIRKLRIPPAWTDVRYSADPSSALQVVGRDAKGREQRIYSLEHAARQAEAKFRRVQELDRRSADIERRNAEARSDPKQRDVADALALVMATGIRPGSTADTGGEKRAYGATTLEGRHVHVDDNGDVRLKFVGKKGVNIDIPVQDRAVAAMLRERAGEAGGDGKLFPRASAGKLLDHVHGLDPDFKTKDFRTLLGTRLAYRAVKENDPPRTEAEYKRKVRDVAVRVSSALGNTPTVALQSYIAPEVFGAWRAALDTSHEVRADSIGDIVRAAGVMIVTKGGKVLLLKRSDTGQWAFPGGHIEADETAEKAAARECREEIGRKLSTLTPWVRRIADGVDFTTFLAKVPDEFAPALNDEHTEYCWLPVDDLAASSLLMLGL